LSDQQQGVGPNSKRQLRYSATKAAEIQQDPTAKGSSDTAPK
jgi:hypothetical protein